MSKILSKFQGSRRIDIPILFSIIILTFFGLIMVYDASVVQAFKDYGDKYFYIKQQFIWVLLGFGFLTFFSFFDYHNLKKISPILFIISFILLLAVFVPGLGLSSGGAHRWLRIGTFSIQPAEIIKLTAIIFLAAIFEKRARVAPFLLILVLVSIVIGVFQKDLGSTIVFFLTCMAIFFIAGGKITYFALLIPFSVIGFIMFVLSSTYRKHRILAFLDPFADPQGYTYHISQVLIALGTGGIMGLGLGQSRQKFEYIPEVTTDSIFAIIGEELGFLGAIFLLGLFCYLIYRGIKISENASDNFGRILSFGLIIWLGIQAIINLGSMVALFPLTGVPLPFISYGGSALLANLVAIGILLNISKFSKME